MKYLSVMERERESKYCDECYDNPVISTTLKYIVVGSFM